jgi:hypothetical protein
VRVSERQIIFGADSVRAILDGRKTMTRRVMRPQPSIGPGGFTGLYDKHLVFRIVDNPDSDWFIQARSPYGTKGDRLWVRETWMEFSRDQTMVSVDGKPFMATDEYVPGGYGYRADLDKCGQVRVTDGVEVCWRTPKAPWRSPLHMPRAASRLTLEVTRVRVERVQEVSAYDVIAEGIDPADHLCGCDRCRMTSDICPASASSLIEEFAHAWDAINAKRAPWASNPFVWCVSFKPVAVEARP